MPGKTFVFPIMIPWMVARLAPPSASELAPASGAAVSAFGTNWAFVARM